MVTQVRIHVHTLFSHRSMLHHQWLGRVPSATQQDLIANPFQGNHLHLPIHPTPSPDVILEWVISGTRIQTLPCGNIMLPILQSFFFFFFPFFSFFFFFFFLSFVFWGLHLRHMALPRLEVQSELWPPAYARATAMPDPSRVCNLHHSSHQHPILNPLSQARDGTHNLMVPSQIWLHCTMTQTHSFFFFLFFFYTTSKSYIPTSQRQRFSN